MAKHKDPNRPNFKTTARNRTLRSWFLGPKPRPEGYRRRPVLVRLDPQPGVAPSEKPPVRIYLGSEPAQYRAERIFVWSIMQVRDPARAYEIYMMKDLEGFDRSEWKTGFTNYRYAIPGLAGGKGRAIYNDVDQIYLGDPAELFDCDMGGAGVLSIDDKESSVMLLDCEKLADLWPLEDVQVPNKHKTFRKRVQDAGLWGYMSGIWNARDPEYVPGESKLLHFTILHAQPWHPFPKELTYQDNPNGEIWYEMERAADAAGFTLFTKERPSERYLELLEMYSTMHEEGRPEAERTADETFTGKSLESHIKPIAELVQETGAKTILDFGAGKGGLYQQSSQHPEGSRYREMPDWPGVTVTCYDPGFEPFSAPYEGPFDGVISTDVLEHISEEDIAWVLDELFSNARGFVYAVAACYPAKKILPDGTNAHCTDLEPEWWKGQFELAARRNPHVRWKLCTQEKSALGLSRRRRLTKKGLRVRYFTGGEQLSMAAE